MKHAPRLLAILAALAALLAVAAPASAQERSAAARDTIPAAHGDSIAADSIRHPVPGWPRGPELPEVFRRPPPDTREPWPLGPKNRYAHAGALAGAAAGTLLGLAEGKHPVPGAFFFGLFGYMIGMMFD